MASRTRSSRRGGLGRGGGETGGPERWGGDDKRRADFRPAGVLPKQTDPVGGAGVRSPRSRKRSLSSPVAVRKSVTDVTRHVVCALRSATPRHGWHFRQSASDTSTN